MNGIFDVPCYGAEPEAEEDAALSECARNAAEDMTGDAEGHGKRMEECKIGKRTRSEPGTEVLAVCRLTA